MKRFSLLLATLAVITTATCFAQDSKKQWISIESVQTVRSGERPVVNIASAGIRRVSLRVYRVGDPVHILGEILGKGKKKASPQVLRTRRLFSDEGAGKNIEPLDKRIPDLKANVTLVAERGVTLKLDNDRFRNWRRRDEISITKYYQDENVKVPVTRAGLYLVEAAYGDVRSYTVVFVTDIVLFARTSESKYQLFVASRGTGAPVSGCSIYTISRRQRVARTDPRGLAELNISKTEDTLLVAVKGSQVAAIKYVGSPEQAENEAYIYTDRPIYHPGDTVHFKGLFRTRSSNKWSIPRQVPLKVAVVGSGKDPIFEGELFTSNMGTAFGEFQIPAGARLGSHRLSIESRSIRDARKGKSAQSRSYSEEPARLSGASVFEVQEYKKPEIEVKVTTDKSRVVQGEKLTATVSARYYFGEQVKSARVEYSAYAMDWAWTQPDETTEYTGSALMGRGYTSIAKGSARLNDQGKLAFPIVTAAAQLKHDQQLLVQARVTDEAGRVIAGEARALLSYGIFRLSTSQKRLYSKGEPAEIEVTSADYDQRPIATDFKAHVLRYDRDKQDFVFLSDVEGKTDESGKGKVSLRCEEPGVYHVDVIALDSNGREITTSAGMYVLGGEAAKYAHSRNESVFVMADKKAYRPGDIARLIFIGQKSDLHYFVTVEAGTTTKSYELNAIGTTGELKLPITAEFAPNFFVHAVAVQDGVNYATDAYKSPNFQVALSEQQLTIDVRPSKGQFEPGDDATVKIRTSTMNGKPVSAEVSLGVVDGSIYALRKDETADILRSFYPDRHARLRHYDSSEFRFDDISGRGVPPYIPGGVPGGVAGGVIGGVWGGPGDSATSADAFAQPRIRKEFPDTAHWVADVRTDANGQAEVRFRAPDTLTTWRTTARGITEDTKVGSTVNDVISRKNVLLRMSAPRFLRMGDEVTVSAFVHNYLPSTKRTRVSLEVEGLEIVKGEAKDIDIPSAGDSQVDWVLRATMAGKAKFVAKALTNEESDAVENTIPVHPLGVKVRAGTSGILKDETTSYTQTVTFPEDSTPQTRKIAIQLSPSIAAATLKSLNYLTTYPYGCTEQTMSAFVPNIVVAQALRGLGIKSDVDDLKLQQKVAAGLSLLYKNQHESGGWGWWNDDSDQLFMTAYVVAGLSQARRAGYKVEADALLRGRKWLLNNFDLRTNSDLRAYVLYAITLDRPDRKLLDQGWEQRKSLGLYGKILLGLALQEAQDARAAQIMSDIENSAQSTSRQVHWRATEDPLMGVRRVSDIEVTALAVQFLSGQNPRNELLPKSVEWLMRQKEEGEYWQSTKQTATVLFALTEYLKQTRELQAANNRVDVYLNNEKMGTYDLAGDLRLGSSISIELDAPHLQQSKNDLRLEKTGAGRVYWSVVPEYFTATGTRPASDLKIERQYFKLQKAQFNTSWDLLAAMFRMDEVYHSEPLNGPVQRGDILAVRMTVTGNEWKYLMVEDPIPAGTEIIDTTQSLNRAFGYTPYYVGHEYRDDRASFFRTELSGSGQFVYFLRVINPGQFGVSPASAEAMYQPDAFSATGVDKLSVK